MVFVVDEAILNRLTRGKVVDVISGRDERIRQVDIQTSAGVPTTSSHDETRVASRTSGLRRVILMDGRSITKRNVTGGVTNVDTALHRQSFKGMRSKSDAPACYLRG